MSLPTISIVTVTFNAALTLLSNIRSIESQTGKVEHILIDGASSDDTLRIVEANRASFTSVISETDKGIYDAMNKGIKLATSDVLGLLNSDDFYSNANVVEKVRKVFANSEVDACYGDLLYVRADKNEKPGFRAVRYWKSEHYHPKQFYWGWMPPHPTFFVRRRVYEKHGLFNLDLGSAADYELMLRFLLKHSINTVYIPEVLVCMRTGGVSNASLKNRLRANRMDRKAWEVNGLNPLPWTFLCKPIRKIPQFLFKSPKSYNKNPVL